MGIVSLDEVVRGLRSGGGGAAEAWRERVGGKALGLALLVSAGLPVPPALVIETGAYALALRADPSFARFPRQVEEVLTAVYDKARRRAGGPLVVRSSATIEDLRTSSFAGQGYTALGVTTLRDFVDAVRGCYRSLRAPRSQAYLRIAGEAAGLEAAEGAGGPEGRGGIAGAMAVVVQAQVFPQASGVLFTVDPRSGEPAVVVDATYGSGESVAGGHASPDVYAIIHGPASLSVRGRRLGSKDTAVTYDKRGRRHQRLVPPRRRAAFCLGEPVLMKLAEGGLRIHEALGCSQDIEWAVAGGKVWFLQSRPVTSIGRGPASLWAVMGNSGGLPDPWGYNDTLIGDHLWTNVNVGEGLPGVLTPFAWSMAEVFFDQPARRVFGVFAEGAPVFGNVYGRMYLNLTGRASVARSLAWVLPRGAFERLLTRGWEEIWGSTPGDLGLPLIPVPPLATFLKLPRSALLFVGALWRYYRGFKRFRRSSQVEVPEIRAALGDPGASAAALAEAWESRIQPRLLDAGTMVMLTAAAAAASQKQLSLSWPLLRYGRAGALSRIIAGVEGLASVAPAVELWQVSRLARSHPHVADLLRAPSPVAAGGGHWRARLCEVEGGEQFLRAFDAFLSHHGHRSETEFEYSRPSWNEDPAPVIAALALQIDLPDDEGPLIAQRARALESERELRKIRDRLGGRASRLARGLVALHHGNMRRREEARDLLVLWASLGRDFVAAAGRALAAAGLLDRAEDAVYLELGELLAALRGVPVATAGAVPLVQVVAARRQRFDYYRTLPDPPSVLRGLLLAGDLTAGVRKAEGSGSLGRDRRGRTVIRGLPASPGRAVGAVRVLDSPRESALMRPGEVLVTRTANVGWTIIFQSVGAVVTDIGAPFSHAAIVTRELGRPAVVDAKVASSVLRSGDVVQVDGNRGLVTRLLRRRGPRPFRPVPALRTRTGPDSRP